MKPLKLTSIQSPNSEFISKSVAQYLSQHSGVAIEFVDSIPWQQRETQIDNGEIPIGWICGLPYVRKVAKPDSIIELLAAPVMASERYQNKPIYYSDVVVRADSKFQTFEDLDGASWAFNEPGSQSGYNITRYHLATLGEFEGYFGEVTQAGSHERSLKLILLGRVDAAAIDSTVLEIELQRKPEIIEQIRIIETLGPSPIPPYVISTKLPKEQRQLLRAILLDMHNHPDGQAVLQQAAMLRFVAVSDADYDVIREMDMVARTVVLGEKEK
ncbi:MAG: PhnD/SsuA/transferrin family substrate-binding protein [Chloroflexota bacterium]